MVDLAELIKALEAKAVGFENDGYNLKFIHGFRVAIDILRRLENGD